MSSKTAVLVADDDADLRELLARMLNRAGYHVDVACDGEEAIQAVELEVGGYAAVLTDIIMPHREGLETIVHIKRRWPTVKVIAMSGGGRFSVGDLLELATKFGADAVIRKPVEAKELLPVLERVLKAPAAASAEAPVLAGAFRKRIA
jgi:DNA-binding NtrC family response regulator